MGGGGCVQCQAVRVRVRVRFEFGLRRGWIGIRVVIGVRVRVRVSGMVTVWDGGGRVGTAFPPLDHTELRGAGESGGGG